MQIVTDIHRWLLSTELCSMPAGLHENDWYVLELVEFIGKFNRKSFLTLTSAVQMGLHTPVIDASISIILCLGSSSHRVLKSIHLLIYFSKTYASIIDNRIE